jgi:hypothetical protein
MSINIRRNNPGQPNLDGRTCYGCEDDAAFMVDICRPDHNFSMGIRLCRPCACELSAKIELARLRFKDKPKRGTPEAGA